MSRAVRQSIDHELLRIEQEEDVRVLYACESGSRAWGFDSQDSDYDVRFLYLRRPEAYLSIFRPRDVIERPISGMLDVNGWDLGKALLLLRKSNPALLEWLQSPIVYREQGTTAARIRHLVVPLFAPRSAMYHYVHMARGNYREYLQGEQVRLKKYLYVLRPLLACQWIETRGTMPPIVFDRLLEEILPDTSELKKAVLGLLDRKRAGDELDEGPRIAEINAYAEERIAYYEQAAAAQPAAEGVVDGSLDALFRASLKEAWGDATTLDDSVR